MSCENGITGDFPVDPDGVMENLLSTRQFDDWPLRMTTGQDGTTEVDRIKQVVGFFRDNTDVKAEFALAVAGVWSAEAHNEPWGCNTSERDSGGNYAGVNPGTKGEKFGGQTYNYNETNMKAFGYGKGVAQWSWTRNLKFANWYNTQAPSNVKTPGVSMDSYGAAIVNTNMTTQTAFAWHEMGDRMHYDFQNAINTINSKHTNPTTNWSEYEANIIMGVDAVLRGFENGGGGKFASAKQMDAYKGGYSGLLKRRIGGAISAYNAIKDDAAFKSYLGIS